MLFFILVQLTPNYGIVYEIEDWAKNNGCLDLGMSDNVNTIHKLLKPLVRVIKKQGL
jgi:hypothetical protein